MKQLSIIALIFVVFGGKVNGQTSNNDSLQLIKSLKQAHAYRIGVHVDTDYEKAFKLYLECARAGLPQGMNALGNMYKEGMGCEQNYAKARQWYQKAGKAGYARAFYNLGLMYKFGTGVDISYEKSHRNMLKAAKLNDAGGMYGVGYMLYRGQGVEQNYEKAVKWFKKGAQLGSPSCMYQLGLCYRNGYGIAKNDSKAKMCLEKAADWGYHMADEELHTPTAENQQQTKSERIPQGHAPDSSDSLSDSPLYLQGRWKGTKVTYDYSKQYVIKEDPIRLNIRQEGCYVTGSWIENDTTRVLIEGTIADSNTLLFTKGKVKRNNRYKGQRDWQMQQGKLISGMDSSGRWILCGYLSEFSERILEPNKPCYVYLEQKAMLVKSAVIPPDTSLISEAIPLVLPEVKSSGDRQTSSSASTPQKPVGVEDHAKPSPGKTTINLFPNPFSESLRLSYDVESDAKVTITIHSLSGVLLHSVSEGYKSEGHYTHHVGQSLQAGTYLLSIIIGKASHHSLIIKTEK